MSENIISHLRKYIEINVEDEPEILSFFEKKTYTKKQNLIAHDNRCKYHFFVIKGCLRLYYVNTKGIEQTIQFAIENWWITDYQAFEKQTTTQFSIQAIEITEVYQINFNDQEALLNAFPQMERYFRLVYQRANAASQLRTKYLYDFSREEFYQHFNESFPEFTKRIPQHILASYLNMTPEYLSEIKKKNRS